MFNWLNYTEESTEGTTLGLEQDTVRYLSVTVLWAQLVPFLFGLLNRYWMTTAAFIIAVASLGVIYVLYTQAKQFRVMTICKCAIILGGLASLLWLVVCLYNLI